MLRDGDNWSQWSVITMKFSTVAQSACSCDHDNSDDNGDYRSRVTSYHSINGVLQMVHKTFIILHICR